MSQQPPRMPRMSKALGRGPSRKLFRAPDLRLDFGKPMRRGGTVDFGQAIADAILANVQGLGSGQIQLEVPSPTDEDPGVNMRPTVGSVLHYTPDPRGWLAELSDEDGKTWQEPVVGWAVVVTWASYAPETEESQREEGDESEFQSEIQPVLFSENGVELMAYREGVALEGLVMPGLPS